MSKQVLLTRSLSVNPSAYVGGSFSTGIFYPARNGASSTTSTTYARFVVPSASIGSCSYSFDLSQIPEEATVTNVSAAVKAYNSANTVSSSVELYSGTVAKGTSVTLPSTDRVLDIPAGSWTREELQNATIQFSGTCKDEGRRYLYVYGADLNVNYTELVTVHEISASSTTGLASISPSEALEVESGTKVLFTIDAASLDGLKVEDNGVDVTDLLTRYKSSAEIVAEEYPVAYETTGSISGTGYAEAIGKSAENPSSYTGNDSCSSFLSTATVKYTFDLGNIPKDAEILGVECYVAGHLESTSGFLSRADLQVFSGDTSKSSVSSFDSTNTQVVTMSLDSTWTRKELENFNLRFTIGFDGGVVQGATLKVTYLGRQSDNEYYWIYALGNIEEDHNVVVSSVTSKPVVKLKSGSTWIDVKNSYKKVNGVWEIVDDVNNLFDLTKVYVREV